MHKRFGSKMYLPNDGGDSGGGADGAGAGGGAGAGAGSGDGDQAGGAGNADGKTGPKRDPLYADLPDDHPLVKRHEALKEENKTNKAKAKIVDDAENAKKSDATKIAELTTKLEGQPKLVADALRDHLVALHEIPKERAELFLTGDTPELMLRQVTALLEDSGSGGSKRKNYVQKEGTPNGKPTPDENAAFAKDLFSRGGDD